MRFKILLFLLSIATASIITAQSKPERLIISNQSTIENNIIPRTGTDVFCEDFANGFEGNSGWGSWTVEDNNGGDIWYQGGSGGPSGPLAGVAPPIESPTVENGYAIFDADLYNDPDAPTMVFGSITSPYLDFSGMNSVIVEFYQSYIYCCSNQSPIKLEVSTNGTEWVVFDAKGIQKEFSNEFSPNNLLTKVDISCFAANESNIRIRFSFNRVLNPFQTHYFWMIDDVCIHENEVENDLEIFRVANGDLVNGWELYEVRTNQANIDVSTVFRNNGLADLEDVSLIYEIYNEIQSEVLAYQEELISIEANTNSLDCPYNPLDTNTVSFDPLILAIGTYWVKASFDFEEDDFQEDNVAWTKFEITQNSFNQKPNFDNDGEFRPEQNMDDLYESFTLVSDIRINYEEWFCGVLVEFGPNTEVGAIVEIVLYLTDEDNFQDKEMVTYLEYEIAEEDIPEGLEEVITFIPTDIYSHTQLYANDKYAYGIYFPGGEFECTIRTKKDFDCDESTELYTQASDGVWTWVNHQKFTPALSMESSFCPYANVDEIETSEITVYPNPFYNALNIEIPLDVGNANLTLFNAQGKVMYNQAFEINSSKFQLNLNQIPPGFYSGTLLTGIKMHHFSVIKID